MTGFDVFLTWQFPAALMAAAAAGGLVRWRSAGIGVMSPVLDYS
ncbi:MULTISPECIES: hypothetical protein [unclassified Streptomyces]|uniref:Uncharacterized protein n=1 Tax=Streptomyces sp. NBC_00060 TaxID=2975636 RepID=A0AAU2HDC4_9ACTN